MVLHPGGSHHDNPEYYRRHFPPLGQVRALSVHDEPEVSLRRTSEGSNEYESDYGSSSPYDPVNEGGYDEDIRMLLHRQPGETRSQHYERIDQQQLSHRRNLHFEPSPDMNLSQRHNLHFEPSPDMNRNEFKNYDSDDIAELLRFSSEDFTDSDSDDDSDPDHDSNSSNDSDHGGMPHSDLHRFYRENL